MRLVIIFGAAMLLTASFIKPQTRFKADTDSKDTLNSPKILLSFIVEKNGTLSNVKGKFIRCNGCNKTSKKLLLDSAMSILKSKPKWNVGMQNGKPVRVSYSLPVVFELDTTTARDSIRPNFSEGK